MVAKTPMSKRFRNRRTFNPKKNVRKAKPTQAFTQKVQRIISRTAEKKYMAPRVIRDNRIINIFNNPTTQAINLMPVLGKGIGQGDRIGNEVTTKKATLYLMAKMDAQAANTDPPKFVDIYIYKSKRSIFADDIRTDNFLQYGNASVAYDSLTIPECGGFNVNTDLYILKKKIRRQLWNPTETNVKLATRGVQNAMSQKIDITKYFKKKMLFDDSANNNQPTNDNLFVTCVYTNNDTSAYTNSTIVGTFDVTIMYQYEDL